MGVKNILYMRSGPYKPVISEYNMQEIGFAKAALRRGVSTDIVYFSDDNKIDILKTENDSVIRIIWAKGYKFLRTGYYPQLLSEDFLSIYDLIVLTEFSQIMTYLVSKQNDKCVLYSGPYYNLFKFPFIEPIYDLLFTKKINRQINRIYVKSSLAKDYLIRKGYTGVCILGVGLDTEKFDSAEEINLNTKQVVDYMQANRCLLFVGTMCDRKNFPFILDVFKCLKQKYASTYKLVLIGSGSNRYINKYLDMLESKIRDNILYVKNIENAQLKFIYESSDMFILPSKLEIFGMALLEAMYFENCVFTSVNGGSATLIKNGINGFVFDGFNAEVWAKKIDEIEKDNSRLLKVKQEAKRTVNEDYTWDSIIKRFIENLPAQFKF